MTSIRIITPMPNPDCHAHTSRSAGANWKKIIATKSDRAVGFARAREALGTTPPPKWGRASILYRFWFAANRGQDLWNFAQMMKAMLDGIVDAGIITNDNHTVLRPCVVDFGGYSKSDPRCEITITPTQEPDDE